MSDVVVAGCGYTGEAIALRWIAEGRRAWGTTRSVDRAVALEERGIHAVVVDVSADDAAGVRVLGVTGALGVVSVPPSSGDVASQTHATVRWLVAQGCDRIVYLSSTGVYGPSETPVSGATPPAPNTTRGAVRRSAEQACEAACAALGVPCALLRLPGIYGPGRTLRDRLGADSTVPEEPVLTNRIFVDDIASAVLALDAAPAWDAPAYLATDGVHLTYQHVADAICDELGLPRPRRVPLDDIPASRRTFLVGSKPCIAPELHALGWQPRYTDVVEAHREAWRREALDEGG